MIEEYDIGQHIGMGAFARVYRARERSSFREVALRIISHKDHDERRWENEIEIHRSLLHKHVLEMQRCFEQNGKMFMVTELCAKGTLYDFLAVKIQSLLLHMTIS
jgi:serine/threonine protein kinase